MSSTLFPKYKAEPLSPLNANDEVAEWFPDDTFYQTILIDEDGHDNIKFEEDDLIPCESKAEVASLMLEHLENLIDLDELIKDEPFLLDEKILPILDDEEQPREVAPLLVKMEYHLRVPDTQSLLKEFENVYDVVEFSHETLTPPQSPPSEQKILTTLEPLYAHPLVEKPPPAFSLGPAEPQAVHHLPAAEYPSLATPQPDIAHELAVVDELVRTRVEDMQWTSSGPSSPNSNSCTSSNFGDCSSDDPEWMPETVNERSSDDDDQTTTPTPQKASRKRSKPYSRSTPVDKKSRKKEQNKNAATRYRMKKKAEVEVILTEEKQLQDYNGELENKISDVQREIKYLKGLMRDLFKAKGLIN